MRAFREPVWDGCGIWIVRYETGKAMAIVDVKTEEVEEYSPVPPLVRLSHDEAQELVNSLWEAGYRPSQDAGSSGQLSAVKYHLEDMRKLVFDRA